MGDQETRHCNSFKYQAISIVTREIKWLENLFFDLGFSFTQPIPIFCDGQAANYIVTNHAFHERTKHIEKDCHLMCDAVTEEKIRTVHISTTKQLVDLLTKALRRIPFHHSLFKLRVQNLHAL